MILVDFSGSVYAAICVSMKMTNTNYIDEMMLRHLILNQMRSFHKKFYKEYGKMVICLDGRHNWRKEIFPNYKLGRKLARIDSGIDWTKIFKYIDTIIEEFIHNVPYVFIRCEELEADDLIAIIARNLNDYIEDESEKTVIISNDKDYKQLHHLSYIEQYLPRNQTKYKAKNPRLELLDLIIHGDRADGIPNIRSDINVFADNKRQLPITTVYTKRIMKEGIDWLPEFEQKRFRENEELISFSKIPNKYIVEVKELYQEAVNNVPPKMNLMTYLGEKKLSNLLGSLMDF